MSQNKRKKGKNQNYTPAARRVAEQRQAGAPPASLDDPASERRKFNPLARNILLGDLVLLAAAQLLYSNKLISDFASGVMTLIGLGLLVVALVVQFRPREGGPRV